MRPPRRSSTPSSPGITTTPSFSRRRQKNDGHRPRLHPGRRGLFLHGGGAFPRRPQGLGPLSHPLAGGGFRCEAHSDKGEALLAAHAGALRAGDRSQAPSRLRSRQWPAVDLKRSKPGSMPISRTRCGRRSPPAAPAAAPAPFSARSATASTSSTRETKPGGARRKSWDACGFGKFTHHASGHNPRDVQPQRFRNRVMHKFKYYRGQVRPDPVHRLRPLRPPLPGRDRPGGSAGENSGRRLKAGD